MNTHYFDDETLMAFADGELDEATTLRVEAALETDEALAERLAVFLDSRIAVASAVKPLIDEPVPAAVDDQELHTEGSSGISYWEGAINVSGRVAGRDVKGRGYLEMTGYSGPAMGNILR